MNKYIAILLLAFSGLAFAESYLCVAAAGSGVLENDKGEIIARIYNVEDEKWVVTDESGQWVVKKLGMDLAYFDSCDAVPTSLHCEYTEGWAGVFDLRTFNGTYIASDGETGHFGVPDPSTIFFIGVSAKMVFVDS